MSKQTARLASTQLGYRETPPEAMPYSDVFSLAAAREHARQRVDAAAALLADAGKEGADLAVAGEDIAGLSYAMTYLDDPSIFRALVEESSGYAHEVLPEVASSHRMHLVACFYEPEGDRVFNSSVLFGPDGRVIGRYHKVHLPMYETWLVTAGDSFAALDTDIGPVGLIICYDDMWPESTAACALNGARIICHSSAASPAEYRVRTRAMDAQVFYITSTHFGSRIAAPNSTILVDAGERDQAVVGAEVNLADATLAPEGYWEWLYSGIRDHRERHLKLRRPDAYRVLTSANPPALQAYPAGGLANTPEAIRAIYQQQKEEYRRGLRGEQQRFHWRWSRD